MNGLRLWRWGVKFRAKNRLDGNVEYFVFENYLPVLFHTRKEAREYVESKYGYLRTREDLKEEPFGWKMPKIVKVIMYLDEES